ncbi:MAG TPA: hypothetical protein VHF47_03955 [Acidimicrobiales bacterium]|nr:hypothetical protein [Acidimicrobiales bacterium]
MLALAVAVQTRLLLARTHPSERGQAVAEYALVLLGVAAVALLLGRWATKTDLVGRLLDAVFEQLLDRVT